MLNLISHSTLTLCWTIIFYRLSVAGWRGALPAGHPFELIKRRLYIRNSEAEVTAALASISGRVEEEWLLVPPLSIETLLVDAAAREANSKSSADVNDYWGNDYLSVRAACSTPAASTDFQKALGTGEVAASAYDLSSGNLLWLAGRLSKFIKEQVLPLFSIVHFSSSSFCSTGLSFTFACW